VEELDRKLKVVPIKTGAGVIVSSTTVHTSAQNAQFFGAMNISLLYVSACRTSEIQ
jgi:hypothetical protein